MGHSTPPPSIVDLVDLVRWRAEVATGDQGFWFLTDGDDEVQRLSFARLERRARSLGARIADQMAPGERVLLLYPPSLAYVEAFFGCLFAGAIAVPAYPPNPKRLERTLPRLLNIVDGSGATLVATTDKIAQMAPVLASQAPTLADVDWLATDTVDDAARQDWTPPEVGEETVAFLQYTSGSTGRPKGVILTHGTLMRNEALIRDAFDCSAYDRSVSWLPLYHDMGLIGGVIQPLYSGMGAVLMSPLDFLKRPAVWLETISRFGATMSGGPNFAYDLAVRKTPEHKLDELDLSRWRVACNGAEPVRMATMERFAARFAPCGFDIRAFIPSYGLAEVALVVSVTPGPEKPRPVEHEDHQWVSCGPPLGDFDVRIVDPDSREVLGENEEGELWLRRGSVAAGYWDNEDATDRVFRAHTEDGEGPFLRTGDLGFVDDGELVVTGRLDDMIVIRGNNHYPHDIEDTVQGVDAALRPGCGAAFAVEDDGQRALVIVQEVSTAKADDISALVRRVREEVGIVHGIAPRDVVLIEPRTIEKTSSGKIRRFAAKTAYEDDELAVVAGGEGGTAFGGEAPEATQTAGGDAPTAPKLDAGADRWAIESWLAERIAEASQTATRHVALDEPFSAYGIDSAEAVSIVGELEEGLGRSIPATALYDYPTISALAAHLVGGEGDDEASKKAAPRRVTEDEGEGDYGGRIAIVGMACRFPGAESLEAFAELVTNGDEAITDIAEKRWEGTPEAKDFARGGVVDDVEAFDASFFGISPGEAQAMDPQQRMVLETGWHAVEDAGWRRADMAGSATAVFIGQSGSDFARLYQGPPVRAGSGMASSITANRLSYWLDLQGPSMVVDTACSSSLTALDRAVMELRSGRCDAAIVGGVNAVLDPEVSEAFAQALMLSPTGQCRSFDADADGYVRGEGCGMVVLRRLEDALDDGDRVRAVVAGSAINQNGRTNGLLAPDGRAQKQVIDSALADAGVAPHAIGVVEGQGTGTEMGDAIEARALRSVFDGVRDGREPTRLGSVKAQIGHLEAASGMAGLIKAALMVERGLVGPQVNFDKPNPACELDDGPLRVARTTESWPGRSDGKEARRAGVSAFGFGGTNAHVVVEEPPQPPESEPGSPQPGLVCLSANSEERLRAYADALARNEKTWSEARSVRDLGFSLGAQRDDEALRWSMVSDDLDEVRRALAALAEGGDPSGAVEEVSMRRRPRVGIACPGLQAGAKEAARRLLEWSPRSGDDLRELCDAVDAAGGAASEFFFADAGADVALKGGGAAFCLEAAIGRWWMACGLRCDVAMGRGVGAVAAAWIDGELSLKEAARRAVNGEFDDADNAADVVRAMEGQHLDVVVEAGPGATLTTMARKRGDSPTWYASDLSRRGATTLSRSAGRLWRRFGALRPQLVNAGGRRVELAKTPFLRKHYWPDSQELRRPGTG